VLRDRFLGRLLILEIVVGAIAGLMIGLSVYNLNGQLFKGVYVSPFELLSSAVNNTLVPDLSLLNSLAIGNILSLIH
jgi:hypothetical protein